MVSPFFYSLPRVGVALHLGMKSSKPTLSLLTPIVPSLPFRKQMAIQFFLFEFEPISGKVLSELNEPVHYHWN